MFNTTTFDIDLPSRLFYQTRYLPVSRVTVKADPIEETLGLSPGAVVRESSTAFSTAQSLIPRRSVARHRQP
jgi:hypothetical protein